MTPTDFIDLLQQAVWMSLMLASPLLVVALLVGVLISILQTITQVQEATLTFVPKILVTLGVLVFLSPWLVAQTVDYTQKTFEQLVWMAQNK